MQAAPECGEPGVGFQQLVTLRFYNPRIPMALSQSAVSTVRRAPGQ